MLQAERFPLPQRPFWNPPRPLLFPDKRHWKQVDCQGILGEQSADYRQADGRGPMDAVIGAQPGQKQSEPSASEPLKQTTYIGALTASFVASELQHHHVSRMLQDLIEQLGEPRLAENSAPAPAGYARHCLVVLRLGLCEVKPLRQVPVDKTDLPFVMTCN